MYSGGGKTVMTTFFIKTFGCRVNQVESQAILEEFKRAGFTPAESFETADICLLNTCTVTHQADKDVEKLVRQILRRNPSARLVLTGCYAAAHKEHITATFPTVEIVGKYDLGRVLFAQNDICWTVSGHEGHSRAFIKIQDGCDNFCSYCIVPYARSVKRSKPVADVLREIKQLVQNGFLEIVLTGIHLGHYGLDFYPPLDEEGAKRIDALGSVDADDTWTICVYMVGSNLEDSGENDLSAEDGLLNYWYTLEKLPKIRVLCSPVEPSKDR